MKENEKITPASLLDGFLDDTLTPEQREVVEKAIKTDAELATDIDLQNRIDQSLQKMFVPQQVPTFDFAAIKAAAEADVATDGNDVVVDLDLLAAAEGADRLNNRTLPNSKIRIAKVLVAALAASLVWGFFGVQLFRNGPTEIAFERRPLVEVYQDCVDGGFQPYWVCDNEKLFASTFEKRQGVALKLAEMPPGMKMVGLAYLAGVSRQSTSLLAEVDGEQVIVFVDRIANDGELESGDFADASLNVYKSRKNGLVFYEVSPLENPEVMDFLVTTAD